MTVKPLRLCKFPRCRTRVSSHKRFLCDFHLKEKWKGQSKRERSSFYESMPWRKFAAAYKRRFPFCRECAKNERTSLTDVVDHIQPIKQKGEKFEESNLQPLCHSCHNRKRQKEMRQSLE